MQPEIKKHLTDIRVALDDLAMFVRGKHLAHFEQDKMLRSAIERQLITLGEALTRLVRDAPTFAEAIPDRRRIIAFRNILVHGYDVIENRTVWGVLEGHLPALRAHIDRLLNTPDAP